MIIARVYVAGKLNDPACGYVRHMHRMIKTAIKALRAGFSVFVPCLDILMGLVAGDFSYEDYFYNSQPWLASSDAVLLTPGWESSEGTKREIAYAQEQGIPIFTSVSEMKKFFQEKFNNKGL